jgi:hypothetical protein
MEWKAREVNGTEPKKTEIKRAVGLTITKRKEWKVREGINQGTVGNLVRNKSK